MVSVYSSSNLKYLKFSFILFCICKLGSLNGSCMYEAREGLVDSKNMTYIIFLVFLLTLYGEVIYSMLVSLLG